MEISELRIGNYVRTVENCYLQCNFFGFDEIIFSDNGYVLRLYPLKENRNNFIDLLLKDADPIPITEDILTKCGFVATHNFQIQKQTLFTKEDFWILYNHRSGFWGLMMNERIVCEIKFLHQLQNLYFDLTGNKLYVALYERTENYSRRVERTIQR